MDGAGKQKIGGDALKFKALKILLFWKFALNLTGMSDFKIYSLGENAVTVEFGNEMSSEINNRVFRLDDYFDKRRFPGFIETIPAYASLSIFFDVSNVRKNFSRFATAFDAVNHLIRTALENLKDSPAKPARTIEIPVCFADEFALDINFVCEKANVTKQNLIEIFTAETYRIFMIGFLPGFAYMGEVDEKIAVPRKETPRLAVPKGSVGIAGAQTGIYPLESPGGWQIIGRTGVEMFDADADQPCFLQPGDLVKFYPVEKLSFAGFVSQ